ncbi:hypothetical protein K439DRAFT_1622894 [Ramaria rubella]|nr:hypothetical protein K439DRAFT_1622894 [Ramaria rubella]
MHFLAIVSVLFAVTQVAFAAPVFRAFHSNVITRNLQCAQLQERGGVTTEPAVTQLDRKLQPRTKPPSPTERQSHTSPKSSKSKSTSSKSSTPGQSSGSQLSDIVFGDRPSDDPLSHSQRLNQQVPHHTSEAQKSIQHAEKVPERHVDVLSLKLPDRPDRRPVQPLESSLLVPPPKQGRQDLVQQLSVASAPPPPSPKKGLIAKWFGPNTATRKPTVDMVRRPKPKELFSQETIPS